VKRDPAPAARRIPTVFSSDVIDPILTRFAFSQLSQAGIA
jgi:hypothetical protein